MIRLADIGPSDPWERWARPWAWSVDGSGAMNAAGDAIIHDEIVLIVGDVRPELLVVCLTHRHWKRDGLYDNPKLQAMQSNWGRAWLRRERVKRLRKKGWR